MNRTERVQREVIENTLLVALDDKEKVAVVFDQRGLLMCIDALTYSPDGWGQDVKDLRDDLRKLYVAAVNPRIEGGE